MAGTAAFFRGINQTYQASKLGIAHDIVRGVAMAAAMTRLTRHIRVAGRAFIRRMARQTPGIFLLLGREGSFAPGVFSVHP